jgi:predicted HTH domain antitoxin
MTTMTLQVPDELEREHEETARFIAAKLYEAGKITLGKAAAMVGMEKWDFAEILINYGVHFMDASAEAAISDARKF